MILLNKTDLVKDEEINKVKSAVNVLNPKAKIATTNYSKTDLSNVMKTGLFNMNEAEQSVGWLQSMREELKTEAEEYGIGSFVYRSRTPFHPNRLINFLEKIFFLDLMDYVEDEEEEENDGYDNEDDDEAAENGNGETNGESSKPKLNAEEKAKKAEEERQEKLYGFESAEKRNEQNAKQLKYMNDNFGHIFRSKGFLWLGGRDKQVGEWSQAGTIGELTCGGPWMCELPEDILPEKDSEAGKAVEADMEPGMIRDRRQELVFIGSDLNKEAITKALDECLLTKEENETPKEVKEADHAAEDVEKNGWKFGWKPKEGEEDLRPTWPDADEMIQGMIEDGEEDEEDDEVPEKKEKK